MTYRYAQERPDYSDYAAGPVLYSAPGRPAFPVRHTSEIFQRCQAHLLRVGVSPPYTVYDPCCGSAYLLVTLAYLHWPALRRVVGSDLDPDVLSLAVRNLALLTPAGLNTRLSQLTELYQQFGKESHAQAIASVERLKARLKAYLQHQAIHSRVFAANALDPAALLSQLQGETIDLVITDLPYGQRTHWLEGDSEAASGDNGWQLLEALRSVVRPEAIIALTTVKQHAIAHEHYLRLGQWQIGKRRTLFFRLSFKDT